MGEQLNTIVRKSVTQVSGQKVSLRWRRTKIIATLGPASDDKSKINQLLRSGVNIFRLNMSHGDHDYHRQLFQRIRQCAKTSGDHVAILMDLCGPKIRVGKFERGSIQLKKNAIVTIRCARGVGSDDVIISQYLRLYKDVKQGERILLDDGNMECCVQQVKGKDVICKVVYGGVLKDNKGLNLPDSSVSAASFTPKDKRDVALAMELEADFVALSFVRSAKDIRDLHRYMDRQGAPVPIIAKIEKPEAVKNIDEVIKAAYGIMIARGDLGIELPAEEVPLIQQELINKARLNKCPVIVATQMMESMISNARPTRAEVGDVAGAAMSSTDAVMLSAETAAGRFPVKAVRMMDKILREIEVHQWRNATFGDQLVVPEGMPSSRRAIADAASSLAHDLKLQGILVPTRSGHTAAVLSAARPSSPLLGVSTNPATCQRLALHWGIIPFLTKEQKVKDWSLLANEISHRCKLTRYGHRILLVSGFNDDEALNEPVLKIINVKWQ